MRTVIVSIFVLTLSSATFGVPQTKNAKPNVDALVAALHSDEWSDRASALEQLRHYPSTIRGQRVRTALWDLADRENQPVDSATASRQDQEAFAEYAAQLFKTVETIVNWSDPKQVCILAHAPFNEDSPFAADLANAGNVIMPCLLQMATSQNVSARLRSVAVMIQIRAKGKVDKATSNEIRAITTRALHDPNEDVRASVVDTLGGFGREDMIPELQQVAESDPAPAIQGVSIRTTARTAIAAIQKRVAGRK